jgi:cytosine/adenosine deaminase-related metal-dependent hydrolase
MTRCGIGLCLGSDSHAIIDLFEEARAVELDERLATGTRGHHPPSELLVAATSGGAQALGWPETGRLAVGACADFCTLDSEGVGLGGTLEAEGKGAAAAAVFAGGGRDVTHVVIAGRLIVDQGVNLAVERAGRRIADVLGAVLRSDR